MAIRDRIHKWALRWGGEAFRAAVAPLEARTASLETASKENYDVTRNNVAALDAFARELLQLRQEFEGQIEALRSDVAGFARPFSALARAQETFPPRPLPREPDISIVINTNARAASLASTLASLPSLDYPNFEVCVVCGPAADGTREVLDAWKGRIKIAECPEPNLAMSRNIGIAESSGHIVAFIDDDAIPEPEWLRDLARAYEDPRVGGAGGLVYDGSGVTFQHRYVTINRVAESNWRWDRPAPELNFPYTANFPHLLGTNCSFRRDTLLSAGGFDEEYEYYLEETDVACRLIDQGWRMAQVDGAYVHHMRRASSVRTEKQVVRSWYSILKNTLYFSLRNGRLHYSEDEILEHARAFADQLRNDVTAAIAAGDLAEEDGERFEDEVERAWRDGLSRGKTGERRLMPESLRNAGPTFLRFAVPVRTGA